MSWTFELVSGPYGGTTEGPVWDGQNVLFRNNALLRNKLSVSGATNLEGAVTIGDAAADVMTNEVEAE